MERVSVEEDIKIRLLVCHRTRGIVAKEPWIDTQRWQRYNGAWEVYDPGDLEVIVNLKISA